MSAFFVALFFLPFLSCEKSAAPVERIREVQAAAAELRELSDETGGFGALSFLSKTDISSPQDGTVKRLYFREGDTVRRGEIVILLENPQIRLAVGRAENAYTQAEAAGNLAESRLLEGKFQTEAELLGIAKAEDELVQARRGWEENRRKQQDRETLFEAGGIPEEAVREGRFSLESELEGLRLMEKELEIRRVGYRDQDLAAAGFVVPPDPKALFNLRVAMRTAALRAERDAALARLDAAAKELESARLAFSELTIRSPNGGIVGARYFEEGERVKREDKILTLMDTSSLYAVFSLRESEALKLKPGMKAQINIDGTGGNCGGTVDLVYPQADSQSLSFVIRVLLENAEGLRPGMFARVKIPLGEPRKSLVVPQSSIRNRKNGEGIVLVIKGNYLLERKVGLGVEYGGDREIISGLSAGEAVVLKPDNDLGEGDYVRVAE
jgi:multidrug efflux pump subunit AcrA (membrane-fusion protein)